MTKSRLMILALILSLTALSACSSVKDAQTKPVIAPAAPPVAIAPVPAPPQASREHAENSGIGNLIKEYEGVVVARSPHATLVRVDQDLDRDGVAGRNDKCPGTLQDAPVNAQGCWAVPAIRFERNSLEIPPRGKAALEALLPVLRQNPSLALSVEGHACNLGDPTYNQALSLRRAQAVKDHLASRGVDKARMTTVGFSSSKPLRDHSTRENRIRNRRVEIRPVQD